MERYCCLEWIRGRVVLHREQPQAEGMAFAVCWICKRRFMQVSSVHACQLQIFSAWSIKCMPCIKLQEALGTARKATLNILEMECKKLRQFLDLEFTCTAAERLAVRDEKTFTPTQHLDSLRVRFPYDAGDGENADVDDAVDGFNYDTDREWESS